MLADAYMITKRMGRARRDARQTERGRGKDERQNVQRRATARLLHFSSEVGISPASKRSNNYCLSMAPGKYGFGSTG